MLLLLLLCCGYGRGEESAFVTTHDEEEVRSDGSGSRPGPAGKGAGGPTTRHPTSSGREVTDLPVFDRQREDEKTLMAVHDPS